MLRVLLLAAAVASLVNQAPAPRRQVSRRVTRTPADVSSRRRYINLTGFPFPLGPFATRRTVRETIVKGRVWGFEQAQNLFGIAVNVRMVVVKLRSGDLWVYNPVAPTVELLELLEEVGGNVKYVVLGTTQYEHKIYAGPFSRKFPEASVHCVPDQYSFPLNLNPRLLGISPTRRRSTGPGYLSEDATYGWKDEFDLKILRPEKRLAANYAAVEAAFVHRDTKTLILTDALVNVPKQKPDVVDDETMAYLGRRDSWVLKAAAFGNWRGQQKQLQEAVRQNNSASTQDGWMRNALLALTFGPSPTTLIDPSTSFNRINNKWIVPPVCESLVYASPIVRPALKKWVEALAKLDFVRVAPSHFAVAECSPADFKNAFANVLDEQEKNSFFRRILGQTASLPQPDAALLGDIARVLTKFNII